MRNWSNDPKSLGIRAKDQWYNGDLMLIIAKRDRRGEEKEKKGRGGGGKERGERRKRGEGAVSAFLFLVFGVSFPRSFGFKVLDFRFQAFSRLISFWIRVFAAFGYKGFRIQGALAFS